MINFKYALLQLVKKTTTTFFIVLQIALAFFLMFTLIEVKNGTAKTLKDIDRIYEDSNDMFTIFDLNDIRNMNNSDIKEKISKYINEKGYNYITSSKGFLYIDKNSSINNLSEIFLQSMRSNNYYDAGKIELDHNGYKYFKLEVSEGRGLEEKDFLYKENEYVPVLVGKELSKHFKVGDVFQGLNNDKSKKFKVIGVLKENLSVFGATGVYDIVNTNSYFIIPKVGESNLENFDAKIFFGRKASNLKNFKESVEKDFNEMNISTQVNLVDDNLKDIEKGIKTQRRINNITFIVVLLFSSVGFISSLLYSINKRLSEFGVHLMSGGTISDIAKRTFIEVSIQIIISFVVAYIFRTVYVPYKMEISDLYESILYAVIISISISIIPVTKVLRINIDQLLRGRE
ncbi:MacB-like core domain-containing protein [Clostridium amylolyticum]|uniref:MacB-like core domain-containing protein n=1 Tax=Clostridium amylolyticum TaxID=1121298 RepID=A0A1M6N6K9_9CLOT|nr:ABC transporter permease [Clostridium amylolyticum]SHJ91339.1 MacB-like core domain-containing protein [Clostridium amylolyticum]